MGDHGGVLASGTYGRQGQVSERLAFSGARGALHYVLWAGEDLQVEEIHAILEDAAPVAGDILMTTIAERLIAEGKAKGKAEGKAEGEAEGRVAALLTVLQARGLVASAKQRARVEACTDVELLDHWTRKAVTAESVDEVLD